MRTLSTRVPGTTIYVRTVIPRPLLFGGLLLLALRTPGSGHEPLALPPGDPCFEACGSKVDTFFNECPGDPESCALRAAELFDECVLNCAPPFGPDDCGCFETYEEAFLGCESPDLDPFEQGRCYSAVDGELCKCMSGCLDEPDLCDLPPLVAPPLGCDEFCELSSQDAAFRCAAAGRSPEECSAVLANLRDDCLQICEEVSTRTQAQCARECTQSARDLLQRCAEEGEDADVCRERANELIQGCLSRCGRDIDRSCGRSCSDEASSFLAECVAAGLPQLECVRQSNEFLSACVARCDGSEAQSFTCEGGCEVLERLMQRECLLLGGVAEECTALSDRVQLECTSFCESGAPGAGTEACGQLAEELRADCSRELPSEACNEIAEQFLRDCQIAGATPAEEPPGRHEPFVRGDAQADGVIDISDAIAVIDHLFKLSDAPCEDAADANDSGTIDVADALYLVKYLTDGGPAPPPPNDDPGFDPTADALLCATAKQP